VPTPYVLRLRRQRLSPRETVVVATFGTTTVEGEPPSGRTVAPGTVQISLVKVLVASARANKTTARRRSV
jgi:hypothetical protein